jgi:hypothetical protein
MPDGDGPAHIMLAPARVARAGRRGVPPSGCAGTAGQRSRRNQQQRPQGLPYGAPARRRRARGRRRDKAAKTCSPPRVVMTEGYAGHPWFAPTPASGGSGHPVAGPDCPSDYGSNARRPAQGWPVVRLGWDVIAGSSTRDPRCGSWPASVRRGNRRCAQPVLSSVQGMARRPCFRPGQDWPSNRCAQAATRRGLSHDHC